MSAYDFLGYAFTTLSFLSVICSVFTDKAGIFACILFLVALLSFSFLIWHLRVEQNKNYTLQVLARENRIAPIRLLLTYERLRRSGYEYAEKFCPSKFHMQSALYSFEIQAPDKPSERCDFACEYTFQFGKKPSRNGSFDILIAQSSGDLLKTINYRFSENGKVYTAAVEEIIYEKDKSILSGLWKAKISWNSSDNIQTLIVSYTLRQVYRAGAGIVGAVLICPFLYGKKINELNIELKDKSEHTPQIVSLGLYPFNGKRCPPEKIHDLSPSDNDSIWTIEHVKCITNGIYILDIYR